MFKGLDSQAWNKALQRGGEGVVRSGSLLTRLMAFPPCSQWCSLQKGPRKVLQSCFEPQLTVRSGRSWHMASSEPIFLTPPILFPMPSFPACWLPPELLALWTHCAQPPPKAQVRRRRPPQEPEEEAAEREVAAEEIRKAETPSDIEVTTPIFPRDQFALPELQQAAFCQ